MAGEMLWATNSGVLTNNKLSKHLQYTAQPLMKFRQFVSIKEAFGKQAGQSVNWNKVANVGTFGGLLTETGTMNETTQAITQGTLTVSEYGNAIPFTFKIQALSEFDIKEIIDKGLKNDMVKCIDGVVEREFNKTKLRYVGTSTTGGVLTTNGTATVTNTSILNAYHVRKMVDELKKRNVPGYDQAGGDYVCIASIEALSGMAGAMESINQYVESGAKKIANGEVGRYYGCRFVEDRFGTRFTYDSSARTATAKSWTQAQSLDAYIFGADTVREAVVVPEEMRAKVVTDYGRSYGLAWYFLGGFQLEWTDEPNSRIIKWDSAA